MPIESSRGLGQGAAQVFDTSGLANQYAQQEGQKAQAKYVAQKDLEKKIAEVSGGLNDVFKEKIFATRDRYAIQGLYDNALKQMEGKWSLAADPSTKESREWNKLKQDVYLAAAQSYETKQLLDEANKNIDDYTPETKQYLMDVYNNPLTVLDPTKLKKINTFDPDKWFQTEVQTPFFKEVEVQNQKDIGFNDKGDYVVTGTRTVAPDEQIDKRVEIMLQNIYSDPKKLDKFKEVYSDELEGLNPQEQLDKLPDLINRDYRDRLKYNKSDYNYNQKTGGDGAEEPFNPNNIIENVTIKTGGDATTGNDPFFSNWISKVEVKDVPTVMYQTKPIDGLVAISNKTLSMRTGKPTETIGNFKVKMGSPMNYKGELMIPAISDEGESLLIPAEEVQEVFAQKGYDMPSIAKGVGVKNFGANGATGKTTYNIKGTTYSLDELKKMGYTEQQVSKYKIK